MVLVPLVYCSAAFSSSANSFLGVSVRSSDLRSFLSVQQFHFMTNDYSNWVSVFKLNPSIQALRFPCNWLDSWPKGPQIYYDVYVVTIEGFSLGNLISLTLTRSNYK